MRCAIPQNSALGRLRINGFHDCHDEPRLFSVINNSGQLFMAIAADGLGTQDLWLYAKISQDHFRAVKDGRMLVTDVFRRPEGGSLWVVALESKTNEPTVTQQTLATIDQGLLPTNNAFYLMPAN